MKIVIVQKRELVAYSIVAFLCLTFVLIGANAEEPPYAQPPNLICPINGSVAVSVDTDSNGNIYAAILSEEHNGTILKCSPDGVVLWEKRFDGDNKNPSTGLYQYETEGISALVVDDAGNTYVTGEVYNETTKLDCMIKKLDAEGELMGSATFDFWTINGYTTFGNDLCHDVHLDNEGNIIAAGLKGHRWYSSLLLKYDQNLNLLDQSTHQSKALPALSQILDISINSSGVIFTLEKYDLYARLIRGFSADFLPITRDVEFSWGETFIPKAIAADHWGNVFVGGSDMVTIDGENHVYPRIHLYDGNMEKYCASSPPGYDDGNGCYIVGDYFVCPENGDSIWGMTLLPDYGENLVVATGSMRSTSGSMITTMKYDYNCQPQWDSSLLYDAGDYTNRGRDIAVDPDGYLIIVGQTGSDPVILKYSDTAGDTTPTVVIDSAQCTIHPDGAIAVDITGGPFAFYGTVTSITSYVEAGDTLEPVLGMECSVWHWNPPGVWHVFWTDDSIKAFCGFCPAGIRLDTIDGGSAESVVTPLP